MVPLAKSVVRCRVAHTFSSLYTRLFCHSSSVGEVLTMLSVQWGTTSMIVDGRPHSLAHPDLQSLLRSSHYSVASPDGQDMISRRHSRRFPPARLVLRVSPISFPAFVPFEFRLSGAYYTFILFTSDRILD